MPIPCFPLIKVLCIWKRDTDYEDMEQGNLFGGYNFHVGDSFELTFTPMVGAVIGNSPMA